MTRRDYQLITDALHFSYHSLSDLADGCIGVSLWFDTMENAVAYGENDSNKDLMIVFDAPQKKESKV